MSQKTFCDKCDQELVIPDEKVDFVTGQPSSGKGDICWQCRLKEVIAVYNEKTRDLNDRPRAIVRWSPPTMNEDWTKPASMPYVRITPNAEP